MFACVCFGGAKDHSFKGPWDWGLKLELLAPDLHTWPEGALGISPRDRQRRSILPTIRTPIEFIPMASYSHPHEPSSHATFYQYDPAQVQLQQPFSNSSDSSGQPTDDSSRSISLNQTSNPSAQDPHAVPSAQQHGQQQPQIYDQYSSHSVPVSTGTGPTATAPFLKDFNLVAEAARRAQMAVMMREMEGVSL